MSKFPATLLCDFYKISHPEQYPAGTEYVYSTWIPRTSRMSGIDEVVAFGFQGFIIKYLIEYFNENFFKRPRQEVVAEYIRFLKHTLGIEKPNTERIKELHDLGYLPLEIKAIAEGTLVPLRVPMLTIVNTDKRFYWLTNFIESLFSAEVWQPSTDATIAFEYRKILNFYAKATGGDLGFVPFQGHDFSFRGMAGLEASAKAGAGHLLSFVGTDTIPAIGYLEEYYNANIEKELVGTSIPATEHSVMSAHTGVHGEFEAYRELITKIYPSGFVSIVSDTYDLWKVITEFLPKLKDDIMARDGRVVIRPDSGNPVDIICGMSGSPNENIRKGVIELLWDIFGGTVNDKGYKVLDPHIGAIYGDSITLERADQICDKLMEKGFASTNIVFGIGSYTYQMNTRDTFGFAVKATHTVVDGKEYNIIKDPVTDNGTKKSLTGRVIVLKNVNTGKLCVVDGCSIEGQKSFEAEDQLKTIFKDGKLIVDDTLADIRERLQANLK